MNLFSDKATSFNTDATSSLGIEPFPSKYKSVSILEVPSLTHLDEQSYNLIQNFLSVHQHSA